MEYIWFKRNFKLAIFRKLVFLLMPLQFIGCTGMGKNEYQEFKNCTLRPASEKIVLNLEKKISDDNRLIQMSITVEWTNSAPNDTYLSTKELLMTTSVSGQRLLLLPDHFSEMSLGTLSYGIAKLPVTLNQQPEDCLANLTIDDAEHILKYVLLTLPNNPETRNEDGISKLQICNGSRDSYGDCCTLTLTENDIICKALKHERLGHAIKWVLRIITVMVLLQSVSFIPEDLYQENKNNTFTLSDTTVIMHLKVTDTFTTSPGIKWDKVHCSSDNIISNFCEKLNERLDRTISGDILTVGVKVKSVTSIVDEKQLHSEYFPSLGILMFLYVSFGDLIRLRKSSGRCCHCVSHLSCFWNFVDKMIGSLFFILLSVPFILRVLFLSKFNSRTHVIIYLYMTIVFALQSILLVFVLKSLHGKRKFIQRLKEVFKKCLRVTFETESVKKRNSSFIDFVIYVKSYFPLLQFLFLFSSNVWQTTRNRLLQLLYFFICTSLVINCLVSMFYVVVDSVLFYVECFFCTMLGLLLNYDKIVQYMLLFLIVVKYAYDSVSDVENKIRKLTIRVFKVIRELCADTNSVVLIQGNDENRKLSRFAQCKCGSWCWLPRGVVLFDKVIKPENINFKHVSKKFIDDISALPGHLTPGSRYTLLFLSCKEIASVIAILFLVLILVLGFGNVNDLSSSVLTIVSFVTGAVSAILAKLWFKDTEYVADDAVHLSNLIKNHLAEYEEPWIIEEFDFDIMTCERNSENQETDIDIVVERRNDQVEFCHIKPLVQKNNFDWEEAKSQLKRMFLSSSDDAANKEETSTSRDLGTTLDQETDLLLKSYGSIQHSASRESRDHALL